MGAATKLLKPITRQLASASRKGRPLILTVEPGDMLTFREKGTKRRVEIYAGHAYMLAQIMQAEVDYKSAMEKYNEDRKFKKIRKPKRPNMPFSKVYYAAIK